METLEKSAGRWRFGVFEVDAPNLELRRHGVTVKIREQPFRILVYLLEHAGELVSREDLRRVLWPADTFVDFEHSLNAAMKKLREALGDSADEPLYIETVPKRGYRFIAPVSTPAGSLAQGLSPGSDPGVATNTVPRAAVSRTLPLPARRPVLFAFATLLVGCVGTLGFLLITHRLGSRSSAASDRQVLRTIPVTNAPGLALFPAFSPDGREIAFVWDGSNREGFDVYVQLVGADLPLRLTYHKRGQIGRPGWSPDGDMIAFERCDGKQDGLYLVPALGGEEREISSASCPYMPSDVLWAQSGNEIVFVDQCTAGGPFGVVNLSLATGEKRCLTPVGTKKDAEYGYGLTLSPDASTIAVGSMTASVCCDVFTIPIEGGPMRLVISDPHIGCAVLLNVGCGLMWTPDGKSLIYQTGRFDISDLLFRIPISGGEAEREKTYPAIGTFSRDGTRFTYEQITNVESPAIWRADLSAPGSPFHEKRKIINSPFGDSSAQPSPDGTRLVWQSGRKGSAEIFIGDASGQNQRQLTHLNHYSGTPRWSPDGRWIAFDSAGPTGHTEILAIDQDGRNLHPITSVAFDCVVPSWSRDGNAIYFSGYRGGTYEIWKHDLKSGVDVQLTHDGGVNPMESVDGRTVYYSRFNEAGIWQMPASGGPETLVIPGRPQRRFWGNYAVISTGLYFLDNDAEPRPTIEFYDFISRRISKVIALDLQPNRFDASLSSSADGKTVYFTQYDGQSVIKMMEFAR